MELLVTLGKKFEFDGDKDNLTNSFLNYLISTTLVDITFLKSIILKNDYICSIIFLHHDFRQDISLLEASVFSSLKWR